VKERISKAETQGREWWAEMMSEEQLQQRAGRRVRWPLEHLSRAERSVFMMIKYGKGQQRGVCECNLLGERWEEHIFLDCEVTRMSRIHLEKSVSGWDCDSRRVWQNASREEKVRWLLGGRPRERERREEKVSEDILVYIRDVIHCRARMEEDEE
jgi:hypothetical protein